MATKKTKKQDTKSRAGATPKYKYPYLMQNKIDKYFESLEPVPLLDENGKPVIRKRGIVYASPARVPSLAGLAWYLGFKSRQSLYDYESKNENFSYVIERARTRIESIVAENLYSNAFQGAKFTLEAQFDYKGQPDNKIFVNNTASASATANLTHFTDDELQAILKQAEKEVDANE